jgi:hypothetical protein
LYQIGSAFATYPAMKKWWKSPIICDKMEVRKKAGASADKGD